MHMTLNYFIMKRENTKSLIVAILILLLWLTLPMVEKDDQVKI